MCYFNGIKVSKIEYIELMKMELDIKKFIQEDKVFVDGFRYGDYPIIKPKQVPGGQEYEITMAHWEFLPSFLKRAEDLNDFRKKFTTMNAKGEDLLNSKMYANAARNRRCLVLSSGFYEWRTFKPDVPKAKAEKYPYYITLPDREYFFMAGIWQTWMDNGMEATGEIIDTFAIVTTAANPLMAQVHNAKNRMPTILPEDLAMEWMQPGLSDQRITELATYQFPASQMAAHTIHKNFKGFTDPTEAFNYSELPALVLE